MKYFPDSFSLNGRIGTIIDKNNLSQKAIEPWTPLIYLEAMKREKEIVNSLASIAEAFYSNDMETRGNCREIINRYFGGNGNNDFILKLIILQSDGKIFKNFNNLRSCFCDKDQIFNSPDPKFAIIGSIKLENILTSRDHSYLEQRKLDTSNE